MGSPQFATPSADVMLTALALSVDRLTAELVRAFDAREIPCILLKGPAIAHWLYGDGSVRPYADCDLLVASHHIPGAQALLSDLGFRDTASPLGHPRLESHAWERAHDHVDLHESLIGIGAGPQAVWEALWPTTETLVVSGVTVAALGFPARALHVALHAAQHGRDEPKPLEDLRRALDTVSEETWVQAAALARRLQASEAFATGLRLAPTGPELAVRLNLAAAASVEATLRLEPVPLALAIEHLVTTPGWKARLRTVLQELFPTVAFMRWWSPLARRGSAGLVAAYCWRPVYLLLHVGPGFAAWRRARRGVG